ncbi:MULTISPECIES: hypothetical protein [Pedobacter]|uniref:Uncharacterized protein n=1 Tax=Pedobacter heparinus (strain ATCC 13125 / DSM 2366 / CIP 104194 / JCM 7457 / NBRC 12017 / NCIMB 9290 / NRRL B-14731 / HIM 762-3) TaxID=485917 RepID=C6Y463_PEDHD|nr:MULTISPECIES: hypothetical protein [Pedobacter]ACU05506.1 hypothetical protein Phep_3312 [Pedobacter heparinus DSM 2366]MBB5440530.1 ABC-type multidrug transport system fused ATPase/permease subunit [Pedobacter sp. AK017]
MVFIVIVILSFLLQMVLPWWVIVVISFATCGLIGKTGKISLWAPFFAILLLWTGMALFKSLPNNNLLAGRIAEMFGVQSWLLILLLSSLLGAFTAGVSGYCGYHFRKAVLIKKTNS